VDWDDAATAGWSLACAEATTVPLAGIGLDAGEVGGNCEISIGEPAGTNGAGVAAAPLLVASFTGMPRSRNVEPDPGVDVEAVFGTPAVAWNDAG